jgi:UDP-N-acetylmuramyl pentapeptide phosphotransferase/UDP-N-acetylglucosamine-1-phosphate transferase
LPAFLGPSSIGIEAVTAAHLSGLVLAAMIICAVGMLDDLGRLRGRYKFLGQLAAITAVIGTGFRIDSLRLLLTAAQ